MLTRLPHRRHATGPRSQIAVELALIAFSAVSAVIILRTVLVVLAVSERVWIGEFVFGMTRVVTDVIGLLPGAHFEVAWNLTVVDITLLGLIPLFLLGIVATGGRNRR